MARGSSVGDIKAIMCSRAWENDALPISIIKDFPFRLMNIYLPLLQWLGLCVFVWMYTVALL